MVAFGAQPPRTPEPLQARACGVSTIRCPTTLAALVASNAIPAGLAAAAGGAAAFADVAAAGWAHLGAAGQAQRGVGGAALLGLDQLDGAVRGGWSGPAR